MEEGEKDKEIQDISLDFSGAIDRLIQEQRSPTKIDHPGEYSVVDLAKISGLSMVMLTNVIKNNYLFSTMNGYSIDSVIAVLRNYLDEESRVKEPEALGDKVEEEKLIEEVAA